MKVLHIACSDRRDSASRAAGELHRALLKEGIQSRLLIQSNVVGMTEGVERLPLREPGEASLLQTFCFDQNEAGPTSSAFHIGYPGASIAANPALLDCDLIHLHQTAGAISPAEIRALAALGKPIVWSLPDAWAFTGGCFQPGSCARFTENCSACPQISDDSFHLPARLLADKAAQLAGIENLVLLVSNHSLATQARASKIFHSTRIEPLPPFLPVAQTPVPAQASARPVRIVFVCDSPGSNERNAKLLRDLLEATQTYGAFRKLVVSGKVVLVAPGISPEHAATFDLPIEFAESVSFHDTDLLVFPKPDENRPSAFLEARAHGIPVLAFDQAGIGETIEHRKTGWLIGRTDLRPMGEALCYLAANPALIREMSQPVAPNQEALSKILALYSDLLKKPVQAPSPVSASESLAPEFQKIVNSIAQLAITQRANNERMAQLDAAQSRLRGTEELISEAQASLAKLEKRHEKLIASGQLPPTASKELGKIQKSAASLRNKLKWRARRLKIYNSTAHFLPRSTQPGDHSLPTLTPPEIPGWIQILHRLFLQKHWMKHGKKDQYPPRPVRPEQFPKPKLRDADLPRIAVVTPSFQQGDYLEATIQSVLDQNYPNLAYAVHDGGSTDSTLEVLQRYADRVTLWASEPDSGQARAIVSGFEKISGPIMAWLNSDDLFVPGALRYVGEYFAAHPEVDAVYGNRIIINEHGQEIARWVLPPHNSSITPFVDPVPQETLFWRASLWEKVGGLDPSFRFGLDWDLVLRFQKAGANIVRLPYFLGSFRIHSQQKTSARAETIGAEEIAYLRQRETGGPVTAEQLAPYRCWMETCGAVYSRLLELGIRL